MMKRQEREVNHIWITYYDMWRVFEFSFVGMNWCHHHKWLQGVLAGNLLFEEMILVMSGFSIGPAPMLLMGKDIERVCFGHK